MTKLSDTQAILLAAAAQRADGNLLPLPGSLRGGAAAKVVLALLSRGLAREDVTGRITRADSAMNTVWRNDDDGRAVLLKITPEGLAAIGVEPAAAASPTSGPVSAAVDGPADAPRKRGRQQKTAGPAADSAAGPAPRQTRAGTKQEQLIAMLRRTEGATIDQIVTALGWAPHTVRGAFAGALKKKLGLTVSSEKVDARGRVYRIAD
jgi:hypothetical protein